MTSATPYLSPEQFAEILAVEVIVKAKVSAGFDYSRPVPHTQTRSARLEWMDANTVVQSNRDPAKQIPC
jgi:hypothetical protein